MKSQFAVINIEAPLVLTNRRSLTATPIQLSLKRKLFMKSTIEKYSDNMDTSLKINMSSSVDIAGFVLSFGRKVVLLPHWRTEKGAKLQLVTVTIRYTTNASTELIISKSSLAHLYL